MATAKTTAAKKATATKPEGAKGLKVIPKRDGFRRAGFRFSGETIIPLADLSDEQYALLTAEPNLVTVLVDLPAEPAAT